MWAIFSHSTYGVCRTSVHSKTDSTGIPLLHADDCYGVKWSRLLLGEKTSCSYRSMGQQHSGFATVLLTMIVALPTMKSHSSRVVLGGSKGNL